MGRLVAELMPGPPHHRQAPRHRRHGPIGQALARRAAAFGLSIHYHNRRRLDLRIEEALDATYWGSA